MIKIDIKMPKNCEYCPFKIFRHSNEDSDWCPGDPVYYWQCILRDNKIISFEDNFVSKTRPKECPLIPVKDEVEQTLYAPEWECPKCKKMIKGWKCNVCGIQIK